MQDKILVVDDSASARKIISNMLTGFNVLTAGDGKEAIQLIDDNLDIDLVILDLNMPHMNGFEVLDILQSDSKYSGIRTIILTNYDEIDNEIKGLKSGAVDYIRKPVNIDSLRVRIDIHLKLKKLQNKVEDDNKILGSLVQKKTSQISEMNENTKENELLFRTIFDQAPIGIAVSRNDEFVTLSNGRIPSINRMFEQISGRSKEELYGISWSSITHPDDLSEDLDNFAKFKSGEIDGYDMEKRYVKPDGSTIWVHMIIAPLISDSSEGKNYLCLVEDITSRKSIEKALNESERSKLMLLANLPGMAYRCSYNRDWTMQFVSEGCFALTGYRAESLLHNKDLSFNSLISPDYRERLWKEWERLLPKRIPFRYEYEIVAAGGQRKWVLEVAQGVYDDAGNVEALEGIIIDITEQKEKELQIQYINCHDFLTGLYNRRYFEEEILKFDKEEFLPLSVIIVDINGVRLINDAFGYSEGDNLIKQTSGILQSCSRPFDILARTGGDEFIILMPNTDNNTAGTVRSAIFEACEVYNSKKENKQYDISFSSGLATKEIMSQSIFEIQKSADEYLKNRKLFNRKSIRSNLISSILATVYEKSEETEEHATRIADLSKMIGERLNLSQNSIGDLELFSMLHDIGKIAIDDSILKKPGKLTEDEYTVMKTHSEIGFRIANSASELESIAEYILTHHERWDGKGYPQGLAGEAIPLLSRIVCISDSYDAMTNDRVYRKAMSPEAAIEEIRRNSGTQFDPHIAKIFEEVISTYLRKEYEKDEAYSKKGTVYEKDTP